MYLAPLPWNSTTCRWSPSFLGLEEWISRAHLLQDPVPQHGIGTDLLTHLLFPLLQLRILGSNEKYPITNPSIQWFWGSNPSWKYLKIWEWFTQSVSRICACFSATDRSGAERKATKGEYTSRVAIPVSGRQAPAISHALHTKGCQWILCGFTKFTAPCFFWWPFQPEVDQKVNS